MRTSSRISGALVLLLALAACSDDTSSSDTTQPATTVVAETVTPTEPPATEPVTTVAATTTTVAATTELDAAALTAALAADDMEGRDNGQPGSELAQALLIGQVSQFAQPAFPDQVGDAGYLQAFRQGANILAIIPGGDLAGEWVVIGGHYDHLGSDCSGADPADTICNGATDNAAGAAVAVSVARAVAAAGTPRRSVLLALWDAEEDGLLGSASWLKAPTVPVEQISAYINFDIQGADLLPSLANFTVAVGAETGGAALVDATTRAIGQSTLETVQLSLLFGQGRSDHANFASAGVPSVFFTDATGPCYHTSGDDIDVVDLAKLDQQVAAASALALDLTATDTPPVFDGAAPASTYADAQSMLALVQLAEPDFGLLADPAAAAAYLADMQAIVAAGPDAFDDAAIGTMLGGAVSFVSALNSGVCQSYSG